MPWTMLDDAFPEHPKLVGLTMEQGYLWVLAINYANKFLTDGFIPAASLAVLHPQTAIAKKKKMAAALVAAALWTVVDGGWQIHDFADYQLTAAAVKDRRAKRAEAGRKGGIKSGQTRSKPEANASTEPEANASQVVRTSDEANTNPSPYPLPLSVNDCSSLSSSDCPDGEREPRVDAALKTLAERDYQSQVRTGKAIQDPDAYYAACLRRRCDTDEPALTRLATNPELDAAALIRALEEEQFLA